MAEKGDADILKVPVIDALRVLPNFFRGYLQSLAEKLDKQEENKNSRSNTNVDCRINELIDGQSSADKFNKQEENEKLRSNANVDCRIIEDMPSTSALIHVQSLAEKFKKQDEDEKSRTNANVDCHINNEALPAALTLTNVQQPTSGQNVLCVAEVKDPDAEQKEEPIIGKFKNYLHSRPSECIIWSGGFQMLDSDSNKVGKPYGVFHAQFPCKVNKKAFDLSENIPLMLQFKLVPRQKLRTDYFDLCHIALYIFPSDQIGSSKKDFERLFELMESQNSVMLSCIDGVDLMIFTSKQLHADAQDFMKQIKIDCFLCGVFHHAKNNRMMKHVEQLTSPLGPAPDCLTNIDDNKAADMEIDTEHDTIDVEVSATHKNKLSSPLGPAPVNIDDKRAADMEIDTIRGKVCATDKNEHLQVVKDKADFSIAPIHWIPPPKSWVKLNVEGYFHENRGFSTAAGIVRDDSAKWVLGYSFNLTHNNRWGAEMHALHHGLRTLWDNGYKKVIVESSFKEAVECIEGLKSHGGVSETCIDLINRDWDCEISYINSQANKCANWLATHPQDCNDVVIFWKPPEEMGPTYRMDFCLPEKASRQKK